MVFNNLKHDYETADFRLISGIEKFCSQLQSDNISHASINTSGKVWGAKSLVVVFCETFDPILDELFDSQSYATQYLTKQKILIPLLEQIKYKDNCKVIAEGVEQAVFELESLLSTKNPSIWSKIQIDTENLQLLSRLIFAIYFELGYDRGFKWCEFCFRMTTNASRYCQLHSSNVDDTAYRKLKKIKQKIPPEIHNKFLLQRSKRKLLGENFLLVSENKDIPESMPPKLFSLKVNKVVNDLVLHTIKLDWTNVSKDWDLVLNTLPHIKKRCQKNAVDFMSWLEFSNYIKVILENTFDPTSHPYWLFIMLAEAQDWYKFEDALNQNKAEFKKQKIQALIAQGLRNRDIVKQLNVSNSYVSDLRKKLNKNRTSNLYVQC